MSFWAAQESGLLNEWVSLKEKFEREPKQFASQLIDLREADKASEIWACAYAQFVANHGADNSPVASELAAYRTMAPADHVRTYWDDADFKAIEIAMVELFEHKEW